MSDDAAWQQVRRQAIRFVLACPDGHLDDLLWTSNRVIPHSRPGCAPHYLFWRGGGGALRHIDLVCPECGASANLGSLYSREWPCSGRFPERGNERPGCNTPAKIIQRGAANLRVAELQTALTIPPRATPLHRRLEMTLVRATLATNRPATKQALLEALSTLVDQDLLPVAVVQEMERYDEPTILAAARDILMGHLPKTAQDLRLDEFDALRDAAAYGYPAQPSPTPGDIPQFEVFQPHVRVVAGPAGHHLRITPINRLRVVMVQTGYRRIVKISSRPADQLPALVDCVYSHEGRDWYPGVELYGEGIFIDLDPGPMSTTPMQHFPLARAAANAWFDAWVDPDRYEQHIRPEEVNQLHPVFVWWHTLAHRLINALAVDSGYSSAAVRERVFVRIDSETGDAAGGILLYTAQPGGDGTLGGLVALVPHFERVLATAFGNLDACSNDPLCGEESFGPAKYNGAACYACALISETSCEHRNMRLDRNLLLENLP
jgi:hypothetical protein